MAKNPTEPEELDISESNREGAYDQLTSEDVIEGANKRVEIIGNDTSKLSGPPPEAIHQAQKIYLDPIEETPDPKKAGAKLGATSGPSMSNTPPPGKKEETFHSDFKDDRPKGEQDQSAIQTATMIVEAYAAGKAQIPKLIKISEKRLKKLEETGEINLQKRIPIPTPQGMQQVAIGDIVTDFNQQVSQGYETSQQFKDTVIPLLAEELKERNMVMTPRAQLIAAVAQEAAMLLVSIGKGVYDRGQLLGYLKDLSKNSVPTPPPQAAPIVPVTPVTPDVPTQQQPAEPEEKTQQQRPEKPKNKKEGTITITNPGGEKKKRGRPAKQTINI